MYKYKIITKYLFRKLAPLFAASSVMLCVAMMIVVMSVMGGFLNLLKDSLKSATGDIVISVPHNVTGFSGYEQIIDELHKNPKILQATPIVQSLGLCSLKNHHVPVKVRGIIPSQYAKVTNYQSTLHWPPKDPEDKKTWLDGFHPADKSYLQRTMNEHFNKKYATNLHKKMPPTTPNGKAIPSAVMGIYVSNFHVKDQNGKLNFRNSIVQDPENRRISINIIPFSKSGMPASPTAKQFNVVNEIKTGSHEADKLNVYVDFHTLQKMLLMDPYTPVPKDPNQDDGFDDEDQTPIKKISGRVHEILVKAAPNTTTAQLKKIAQETLIKIKSKNSRDGTHYESSLVVQTWEEQNRLQLGAVQNEVSMLSFLIGFMSIVAVFMVALTFYMIVLNKTKDMGILRAIGASQFGIINIFLAYGLAIGILGSIAGLALGYGVVTNLNPIQHWLANDLGVSAAYAGTIIAAFALAFITTIAIGSSKGNYIKWLKRTTLTLIPIAIIICYFILNANDGEIAYNLNQQISFVMWDPRVYVFDKIPDTVDTNKAIIVAIGGILSGLFGAVIPAIIASLKDPVEALRYE